MSLAPGGRISGPLHLAVQFPKTTLIACLAAAGLAVVAYAGQPNFVSLAQIKAYCANPAASTLPASLKHKLDKSCVCISTGTSCT